MTLDKLAQIIERTIVTKTDLKNDLEAMEDRMDRKYAGKEDLHAFATKADLLDFPRKHDLEKLATQESVTRLEVKLDVSIAKIDNHEHRIKKLETHQHYASS